MSRGGGGGGGGQTALECVGEFGNCDRGGGQTGAEATGREMPLYTMGIARAKGNKEWTIGTARAKGNKEWSRLLTSHVPFGFGCVGGSGNYDRGGGQTVAKQQAEPCPHTPWGL